MSAELNNLCPPGSSKWPLVLPSDPLITQNGGHLTPENVTSHPPKRVTWEEPGTHSPYRIRDRLDICDIDTKISSIFLIQKELFFFSVAQISRSQTSKRQVLGPPFSWIRQEDSNGENVNYLSNEERAPWLFRVPPQKTNMELKIRIFWGRKIIFHPPSFLASMLVFGGVCKGFYYPVIWGSLRNPLFQDPYYY